MSWQNLASKMHVGNSEDDDQIILGKPAIEQIISKTKGKSDEEKKELIRLIEGSCRRFDSSGHQSLTVDQYYNVIKLQHHVDCTKEEIRKLTAELQMDKEYRVSIKDFMTVPIMSKAVFEAMDKNKDGLVSKGELRLAQKGISMKDLADILQELDGDGDGKLTFDEVKSVIKRARKKKAAGQSNSKNSSAGSLQVKKRSKSSELQRSSSDSGSKKKESAKNPSSTPSSSSSSQKSSGGSSGKSQTKKKSTTETKLPVIAR